MIADAVDGTSGAAQHFDYGDLVLRRSRRGDVVTWVQAARVVRDDAAGLLLWIPEGSGFGCRVDSDGRPIREEPIDVVAQCTLAAGTWKDTSVLIWNPTNAAHSLWWFFRAQRFTGWYVNLEIRGPRWGDGPCRGIDVADLGLDVVVRTGPGVGRTKRISRLSPMPLVTGRPSRPPSLAPRGSV